MLDAKTQNAPQGHVFRTNLDYTYMLVLQQITGKSAMFPISFQNVLSTFANAPFLVCKSIGKGHSYPFALKRISKIPPLGWDSGWR